MPYPSLFIKTGGQVMDYLVGTWVMAGVAVVIAIVLTITLKVPKK